MNRIIQGDCIEELKKLPNDSVDMVFVDPPYNLGKLYSAYNDDKKNSEYMEWCNRWLSESVRVLKPTGSIFVINIPRWLIYHAMHLNKIAFFNHWIAWDALGSPTNTKLLPSHYGIIWYSKTKNPKVFPIRIPHKRDRFGNILADWGGKKEMLHPYGKIASDIWDDIHRIRHKVRRDAHPCQLPPHLVERMILATTEEGDIVLDPMIGTGTTAVAAKRVGRNYLGIELDKKYVEIADDNVSATEPTIVNNKYVSLYLNKVITIRDKDYNAVESYLKPIEMRINGHKRKIMRLPILSKSKEELITQIIS